MVRGSLVGKISNKLVMLSSLCTKYSNIPWEQKRVAVQIILQLSINVIYKVIKIIEEMLSSEKNIKGMLIPQLQCICH